MNASLPVFPFYRNPVANLVGPFEFAELFSGGIG
jgi:hypothetical protein